MFHVSTNTTPLGTCFLLFLGIATSLAVSLLLAVSSFDKREFPKNRRCGGLMKHELEGSI